MHFKKAAARFTAGMLIASSLIVPSLAVTATVDSGSDSLNVRAAANTTSEVLAKLSAGTQVDVTGPSENGWYPITHQGVAGFVSAEYLIVSEEDSQTQDTQEQTAPVEEEAASTPAPAAEEPAAEETPSQPEAVYGRVTVSTLNVRSGPDVSTEKVGTLRAGRTVEILETLDGWYRIENGYISADYVTIVDASQVGKTAEIVDLALSFVGSRYVYGGSSPSGFDCSGFTSYIYKQFGISLNRTASGQLDNGTPVSMSELEPGDLVLFLKHANSGKRASHVGIYIGNGQFVHASTYGVGVIVSDMDYAYYTTGFVGGRRLV